MEKPTVEQLAYAGGQNEAGGGYWEALIIRDAKGEHYVLHQLNIAKWEEGAKHKKMEFESIDVLLKEFDTWGRHGMTRNWVETNATCGYDVPPEEFGKAYSR